MALNNLWQNSSENLVSPLQVHLAGICTNWNSPEEARQEGGGGDWEWGERQCEDWVCLPWQGLEGHEHCSHCPAATRPPPLENQPPTGSWQGSLGAVLGRWISAPGEEDTGSLICPAPGPLRG